MACEIAIMPEHGMKSPGRYWIADKKSELPEKDIMEGDLCYCKETKSLWVATSDTAWESVK